jgi:hypothetical protein
MCQTVFNPFRQRTELTHATQRSLDGHKGCRQSCSAVNGVTGSRVAGDEVHGGALDSSLVKVLW